MFFHLFYLFPVPPSIILTITSTASLTPLISSATSSTTIFSSSGKLLLASLALCFTLGVQSFLQPFGCGCVSSSTNMLTLCSSVVPLPTTGGSTASSSSPAANVSLSGRTISCKIQIWSAEIPVPIASCPATTLVGSPPQPVLLVNLSICGRLILL